MLKFDFKEPLMHYKVLSILELRKGGVCYLLLSPLPYHTYYYLKERYSSFKKLKKRFLRKENTNLQYDDGLNRIQYEEVLFW